MNVRPPAVAGSFYPDDPVQLRDMVAAFLHPAGPQADRPKALIAPHAGLVYSGPIAGSVYGLLEAQRGTIRRVALLGPSHRVAFPGLAAPGADAFSTPLGEVPVDTGTVKRLVDEGLVVLLDRAHRDEHALEVHLPFLQEVLHDFRIIPLVVGDADPSSVEAVLDAVWGGPETLIVISSDLSHYYPYETACRLDRATAEAVEHLAPDDIGQEQACGRVPVQGLLRAARRRGLHARTVDLRNSGDTAGPRTEVVGYGGFAFE